MTERTISMIYSGHTLSRIRNETGMSVIEIHFALNAYHRERGIA